MDKCSSVTSSQILKTFYCIFAKMLEFLISNNILDNTKIITCAPTVYRCLGSSKPNTVRENTLEINSESQDKEYHRDILKQIK